MSEEITPSAPGGGSSAAATPQGSQTAQPSSQTYFDPEKHVEKSEFTKLRQQDAQKRQEYESSYKEREQQIAAREQQILQAAQILQQRLQQQQGGGTKDAYSKIRDLPYVDGGTFAEQLEGLRTQDIGALVQAIQQRDKALQLMYQQLGQLSQTVKGFQGKNAETEFEGRLRSVREQSGLPDEPWATEFLKDVYLSHEGDDLADEFPNMVRGRWEAIRKAVRALDKAEAQKARGLAIPTAGGTVSPGKPLQEGYKKPRQLADELWAAMQGGSDQE